MLLRSFQNYCHIERTQKLPKEEQEMERHFLSGEHLTGDSP